MTFPIELFLLFGVAVLCSGVGMYRYTYFISIGYGLSTAGCGGALLLLHHGDTVWLVDLVCVMLIVYGCLLAAIWTLREKGNAATLGRIGEALGDEPQDAGVRIMLWFGSAIVYALMVSPICYRITNHILEMEMNQVGTGAVDEAKRAAEAASEAATSASADVSLWTGAVLMLCGLILEVAFEIDGIMRRKRARGWPGYPAGLILWTGVLVCGAASFRTAGQWIVAGLGYLSIVFLMRYGAGKLHTRRKRGY